MISKTNLQSLKIRTLSILILFVLLSFSCKTKANVVAWKGASTFDEFPESKLNLAKTGVCFSGGGTRAMNCALGQMAGLRELGLWDDLGYVSAVSGGSWASTIFTYYNAGAKNDNELLGKPIRPEKLTMKDLETMQDGFMGNVITDHLIDNVFERLGEGSLTFGLLQKMDYVWIDAVGHTYLKPFGLYDPKDPKYFTLNVESRDAILGRNKKLDADDFIMVHSQEGDIVRPYLIVNSSLVGPSKDLPIRNPENLSVFNYTPLYIGSNNAVTIKDKELIFGNEVKFNAGGGFVEPFGFGGKLRGSQNVQLSSSGTELKMKLPHRRFEAADATGTSSAAYGAVFSSSLIAQLASDILFHVSADGLLPEEDYWPISNSGVTQDAQNYRFTDGGNLENYGLISLLQRGVEKAVVFINTNVPISVDVDIKGSCPPLPSQIDDDLFPLFGYGYGNEINNQVFSQADFEVVYEGLKNAKVEGKTVMTKTKLKTVSNQLWGIKEGHEVEILWVYNETVLEWQDKLPQDIRNEICKGPTGKFPDFPMYKLIGENGILKGISLTKEQVNLLYELSAWNVYSNEEAFKFLKSKK